MDRKIDPKDPIDAAINATNDRRPDVPVVTIPVTISSTGRGVALAVPVDLTDVELRELAASMLLFMDAWIANASKPKLEIARSMPT